MEVRVTPCLEFPGGHPREVCTWQRAWLPIPQPLTTFVKELIQWSGRKLVPLGVLALVVPDKYTDHVRLPRDHDLLGCCCLKVHVQSTSPMYMHAKQPSMNKCKVTWQTQHPVQS